MLSKEYTRAAQMMLPLTESKKNKIAKRAANNMFVVREAEGDYNEAQEWLNRSN
jgi:hypothetical protein